MSYSDRGVLKWMVNSETFEIFSLTLFYVLTVIYILQARWALQQGDTAEVKVTLNRMMFLTILYLLSSINNLFEVVMPRPS
ncbi:hypothetical protein Bpfe_017090 [Biomphalaria pfeifferi]|uniref:Uncharacterized protein n=1 Tax=Biomphalaria pfeifferi TaxID=112525 RepID=A0AAD8BFP5_BIOPF|nr:hypothetical protein Bpfe_017090 [Biomphalaria pfeifferi]